MSYFTFIILKKEEVQKAKELFHTQKVHQDFVFLPAGSNSLSLYDDIRHLSHFQGKVASFEIIFIELYSSALSGENQDVIEKRIHTLRRKGWSEEQLQHWREEQRLKSKSLHVNHVKRQKLEHFLSEVAKQCSMLAFGYYLDGKNQENESTHRGMNEVIIREFPDDYREATVYILKN